MTPKEKAEELVYDKYFYHPKLYLSKGGAKTCALIAVDEVLSVCWYKKDMEYWDEVKQEIEAL